MKKKSLALAAIAVLMVASLATAITLAYFTDSKTAINTFTVGNVKIDLTESNWAGGDNGMKANPGVAVAKNPLVKNVGDNDAYARIKVTVNKADVFGANEAAIKAAVPQIFKTGANGLAGSLGDNWALDTSTYNATDKTLTLVYNYSDLLAAKGDTVAQTSELFQYVTLPAAFNNTQMAALSGFTITVVAEAIQADSFDDSTAAFAALDVQGATEAANP